MSAVQEEVKRGRPEGSKTKISKLQRIANRLEQMARSQSMDIIQKSLNGDSVDKDQLATAKWTVTTAKEFHKAVLAEKELKNDSSDQTDAQDDDKEDSVVFTLVRAKE